MTIQLGNPLWSKPLRQPLSWRRWRGLMPVMTSLTLVGLALWAAFEALPSSRTLHPVFSASFASETSLAYWKHRSSLAFVFETGLHPRQCGTVQIVSEHEVALAPYTSEKCHAALASARVISLHPAGLRLLWSLMPESDREAIAAESWDLTRQITRPFAEVLDAPYFKEHYRDELSQTVLDAMRQTWMSHRIQASWLYLVGSLDPKYTERLANAFWPIAVEKTKTGLMDTVSDLGNALLGQRAPATPDSSASLTGRILQDLLYDPRSQALLFETVLQVSSDPKVVAFANLFATEILLALMANPHLPALVDKVATDPLLLARWQGNRFDFDFLTQQLPRKLLRYRYPRDHNPLVAFLVRSILLGHDNYVVLLMTDEQAAAAAAQGIGSGFPLQAMTP